MANAKVTPNNAPNAPFQTAASPDWADVQGVGDVVEEAAADSFPASDPPAWTPLMVGSPPRALPAREGDCFSYSWPPPADLEQALAEPDDLQNALLQLEEVLAEVTPIWEQDWQTWVVDELREVRNKLGRHSAAEDPESFLADVDLTGPGQVRSAKKLSREHDDLLAQARMLLVLGEKEAADRTADFSHIHRRVELLLDGLRRHQERETDLILESVYTEVGTGD
jgi:hypothetical protein